MDLYRLWVLFLALTGMRPSEAAGMRWDQGLIDTTNGWIHTPPLSMVEQNVGYWACGGVSVLDPEWERKVDQRIAAGQHTGKTRLFSERRIVLLDQLGDEVLGPLEEFRPPDGAPWLFPGRRAVKALNTVFGSVPLHFGKAQRKLAEQVVGSPPQDSSSTSCGTTSLRLGRDRRRCQPLRSRRLPRQLRGRSPAHVLPPRLT
jgi:integrase